MKNLKVYFFHSTKRINNNYEAPVYGRIQLKGERADFATGIFIRPGQWKNGMVRNHLSADCFNHHLSELAASIRTTYSQLKGAATAKELKRISVDQVPFITTVQKFIECQNDKSPNTIKTYRARQALLKQYCETLSFEQINLDMARDYFNWMLKLGYNRNYAVRAVKFIAMVSDYAVHEKLVKHNPLHGLRLKGEGPKKIISLTGEELKALEEFNFTSQPLRKAADLFLFQCYTGFDFADLCTINFSYIKEFKEKFYIIKNRAKTGEESVIPYTLKIENLWNKYDYKLPLMQNQPYNRFLKEISAIIGIDKPLTSHVGRKTFTMLKLNEEGYSLEAVSRMAGHASTKTTETYYAKVQIDLIEKERIRLGY